MNKRFEEIYAKNEWLHGSGEGSLPQHTKGYARFLEKYVSENKIKSVVDMGCGDWQFSKDISWGDAKYHGFDVVPSVIERNTRIYSTGQVCFSLYSGDPAELPSADLLIVKDVLQHLSDATVHQALKNFDRYAQILITNCVNPRGSTINRDISDGEFRYLDVRLSPFNFDSIEAYSFQPEGTFLERLRNRPRWRKKVLLAYGDAGRP